MTKRVFPKFQEALERAGVARGSSTKGKSPKNDPRAVSAPAKRAVEESVDSETGKKYKGMAKNCDLPVVSVIPDQEIMDQTTALLKEAFVWIDKKKTAEAQLEAVREQLTTIASAYDLKGFRFGELGFHYGGYKSKKSLNKEALLLNGVTAKQIEDSMVEGKEYLDTRFDRYQL